MSAASTPSRNVMTKAWSTNLFLTSGSRSTGHAVFENEFQFQF
jgi:hypothetical protein